MAFRVLHMKLCHAEEARHLVQELESACWLGPHAAPLGCMTRIREHDGQDHMRHPLHVVPPARMIRAIRCDIVVPGATNMFFLERSKCIHGPMTLVEDESRQSTLAYTRAQVRTRTPNPEDILM